MTQRRDDEQETSMLRDLIHDSTFAVLLTLG